MSKVIRTRSYRYWLGSSQPVQQQSLPIYPVMAVFLEMGCVSYVCHPCPLFIANVRKIHTRSLSSLKTSAPKILLPRSCPWTAHTKGTFPGRFCLMELQGMQTRAAAIFRLASRSGAQTHILRVQRPLQAFCKLACLF